MSRREGSNDDDLLLQLVTTSRSGRYSHSSMHTYPQSLPTVCTSPPEQDRASRSKSNQKRLRSIRRKTAQIAASSHTPCTGLKQEQQNIKQIPQGYPLRSFHFPHSVVQCNVTSYQSLHDPRDYLHNVNFVPALIFSEAF
jgi:hypothetical protein